MPKMSKAKKLEQTKKVIAMLKKGAKPGEVAKKFKMHHLAVTSIGRHAGVWKSPNGKNVKTPAQDHVKAEDRVEIQASSTISFDEWFNTGVRLGYMVLRVKDGRVESGVKFPGLAFPS